MTKAQKDKKDIERKHGEDPMYQLIDNYLPVALTGLSKKHKGELKGHNITYILKTLKKMGFRVTKENQQ